jgi:putative oxidoreductase
MDLRELETVWGPRALGLLRIVAALLFMEHGAQKLLGFPPMSGDRAMPELFSLIWLAGFLELVGGFLVLIGLFTRPVAFLLSGEMAFAYWIGHAPSSIYPALNGGDAAILYCFIFLYLAVAGPGAYSIDRARA